MMMLILHDFLHHDSIAHEHVIVSQSRLLMITSIIGYHLYVFSGYVTDYWHIMELGVVKTQLEWTFASLTKEQYIIFRSRISRMTVCHLYAHHHVRSH